MWSTDGPPYMTQPSEVLRGKPVLHQVEEEKRRDIPIPYTEKLFPELLNIASALRR